MWTSGTPHLRARSCPRRQKPRVPRSKPWPSGGGCWTSRFRPPPFRSLLCPPSPRPPTTGTSASWSWRGNVTIACGVGGDQRAGLLRRTVTALSLVPARASRQATSQSVIFALIATNWLIIPRQAAIYLGWIGSCCFLSPLRKRFVGWQMKGTWRLNENHARCVYRGSVLVKSPQYR